MIDDESEKRKMLEISWLFFDFFVMENRIKDLAINLEKIGEKSDRKFGDFQKMHLVTLKMKSDRDEVGSARVAEERVLLREVFFESIKRRKQRSKSGKDGEDGLFQFGENGRGRGRVKSVGARKLENKIQNGSDLRQKSQSLVCRRKFVTVERL